MNCLRLTLLILVAASLACTQVVVTPTPPPSPTATPPPTRTPTPTPTSALIIPRGPTTARVLAASVNVRQLPGGVPTGKYVYAGQTLTVLEYSADGEWVRIADPAGWVWRGCQSDNPDGLKCEAAP